MIAKCPNCNGRNGYTAVMFTATEIAYTRRGVIRRNTTVDVAHERDHRCVDCKTVLPHRMMKEKGLSE